MLHPAWSGDAVPILGSGDAAPSLQAHCHGWERELTLSRDSKAALIKMCE